MLVAGKAYGQPKKQIAVEIGSFSDSNETAAWIAYALALAAWAQNSGAIDRAAAGVFVPPFEGELAARRSQIQVWKELNEKERKVFAYMDEVTAVQAAGFLAEYIWTFHRQSTWVTEPDGLRLDAFEGWRSKSLAGHQARTGARLRISF